MIDRESYINFLEMQMEKVSAATLTVENFGPKFESLQLRVKMMEDSLTHLQDRQREQTSSQAQITLKSLLQDKDNEKYLARWISRVRDQRHTSELETCNSRIDTVEEKLREISNQMEKDLRKLQKKVFSHLKLASHQRISELHEESTMLYDEQNSTTKKKKLHHHFHHYPDTDDGGFSEDKMQLIDGFDKLFQQVQSISDSLEEVKRTMTHRHANIDEDVKKLKKEVSKMHVNVEKVTDVSKEQKNLNDRILKLNKKLQSLNTSIQSVKDDQESNIESHDAQILYRLTSIEKRMKSDADETIQMIRSIEREVQQQVYDINAMIESELSSLKDIRSDIVQNYTPSQDVQEINESIDQIMSKRVRGMKDELLSLVKQQQKENQDYIHSVVSKLTNIQKQSTSANRDEKKLSQPKLSTTYHLSDDVDHDPYVTEPSLHSTPRNKPDSSNIDRRLSGMQNNMTRSPDRRKRLKELYKELTDLEMQEFNSK